VSLAKGELTNFDLTNAELASTEEDSTLSVKSAKIQTFFGQMRVGQTPL
jgi:hypothetical protein